MTEKVNLIRRKTGVNGIPACDHEIEMFDPLKLEPSKWICAAFCGINFKKGVPCSFDQKTKNCSTNSYKPHQIVPEPPSRQIWPRWHND